MNIDLLAFDGDQNLKATDDEGGIEGPCAPFGDADQSRMKDRFSPTTDFGRALKHGADLRHHHGLPMVGDRPNALADVTLGEAFFEKRADGLWMKSRMDLSTDAARAVFAEIKAGKYGLSTGSANHLVRRQPLGDGTHAIKTWPIVEVSLTPTPAHPRTGVYAIKSLIEAEPDQSVKADSPYGLCPQCGAPGVSRERRMNGNDTCEKGHVYPSREAKSLSDTEQPAVPATLIDSLRTLVAGATELKARTAKAKADRGARGLASSYREAVEDLADALKAISDDWHDLAEPAAAVPPPVAETVAPEPDPAPSVVDATDELDRFIATMARFNGVAV